MKTLDILQDAKTMSTEREKAFDPSNLKKEKVQKYIDSIRDEINLHMTAMRYQVYEIGRLLYEVKKLLPHGEFDSWIEGNFAFSKSTALNFMNVYTACMGCPELVEYFKPSALYEICAPRFPEDLKKELFENATGVYDINKKELLEVAFKWRNKEVNIDSPEVQSLLKRQKDQSFWKRYKIEFDALKTALTGFKKKFKSLNDRHIAFPLLNKKDNAKDDRYLEIVDMISTFIGEVEVMKEGLNPKT